MQIDIPRHFRQWQPRGRSADIDAIQVMERLLQENHWAWWRNRAEDVRYPTSDVTLGLNRRIADSAMALALPQADYLQNYDLDDDDLQHLSLQLRLLREPDQDSHTQGI